MLIPEPPLSEALLLAELSRLTGDRVLCASLGRAQFAAAFASSQPTADVACNFLDLHQADSAREATVAIPNLHITCDADLPSGECDLAVLPVTMNGDAELTRELLQQMHDRLIIGGQLMTSTDNADDTWLASEMGKLFDKVECRASAKGVVYLATKRSPLKKVKDFSCEFAFRDGERLLRVTSRPSVFSHRHIDTGARALIETMQIAPGDRVFDIGCGSGVAALAAAARANDATVYAVDSNPRAVACTQRGAELNALSNVTAHLNAKGDCDVPGSYDVALANPPYYSHFKIAEIFVDGAHRALRPGGRLYIVTKHPAWYEDNLDLRFFRVDAVQLRGYWVFTATKNT